MTDPTVGWLVRAGKVLASVEVPAGRRSRAWGLLGRDGIDGALLLRPARSVHSFGMRFDLDVAFLDVDGVVIRTLRLHRNRLTPPVWRARSIIEAEAGSFHDWELKIGDVIEFRHADADATDNDTTDNDNDNDNTTGHPPRADGAGPTGPAERFADGGRPERNRRDEAEAGE
ncbi:MAG: DUF192 domain-containing protein [Acidimicrobiales bacterium]